VPYRAFSVKQDNKKEEGKYDFKKDPRIRGFIKNMFLLVSMVVASGKLTYFLLNKFVYGEPDGTSQEEKFTDTNQGRPLKA